MGCKERLKSTPEAVHVQGPLFVAKSLSPDLSAWFEGEPQGLIMKEEALLWHQETSLPALKPIQG